MLSAGRVPGAEQDCWGGRRAFGPGEQLPRGRRVSRLEIWPQAAASFLGLVRVWQWQRPSRHAATSRRPFDTLETAALTLRHLRSAADLSGSLKVTDSTTAPPTKRRPPASNSCRETKRAQAVSEMISMPTLTPSLPVSSESSRLGSYAVWRTLLLLFSLPDGLTASRRTCGPNRERLEGGPQSRTVMDANQEES